MSRYLIYSEVFPSDGAGIVRQTGVGRYCCELATGLAEAGHQVTVFTNDSQGSGIASGAAGYMLQRCGTLPRGAIAILGRAREVRRAVAQSNAEFVVAGDVIAHKVLFIAGAWTRARLLPVLYGSELRSLHTARGVRRRAIGRLRQQFVGHYVARAFGTICISRFVVRELQESALRAQRQVVVYPAVRPLVLTRPPNPSFRLPATAGPRTPDTVRLLTIGRISARKNQLQVLRALVHLKDRVGVRCEYYMLGNVDADVHTPYWRAIQAFIAAHGLEDQVFLLPGSSDEQKIDCIDACDVVVALSRTAGVSTEGFGISAIEGSARGKPVVVSTEGGMPETIIAGETGFCLSPEADTGALTETLGSLVTSPDVRRRMGDAGREFVRQHFTPRCMADSLAAWLDRELHNVSAAVDPRCETAR